MSSQKQFSCHGLRSNLATAKPSPKLYKPKAAHLSRFKNPRYILYTLRELSGLFVSIYMFIFAYQLSQLVWGPTVYQGITSTLQSPAFLAFDTIVLIFALLHSITWIQFNILGLQRIGKIRLNRTLLLGGGILAWLIVSGIVAMLILTG